jgi:hypothetical protein
MEIPERSGLGLTVDPDAVETHLVAGEALFDEG